MSMQKGRKKLKALFDDLGWDQEKRKRFVCKTLDRRVGKMSDLEIDDLRKLYGRLKKIAEKKKSKSVEKKGSDPVVQEGADGDMTLDFDENCEYGRVLKRCRKMAKQCKSLPKAARELSAQYIQRLRDIHDDVKAKKRVKKSQMRSIENMATAISKWQGK